MKCKCRKCGDVELQVRWGVIAGLALFIALMVSGSI